MGSNQEVQIYTTLLLALGLITFSITERIECIVVSFLLVIALDLIQIRKLKRKK